jgi:hypothetical protein
MPKMEFKWYEVRPSIFKLMEVIDVGISDNTAFKLSFWMRFEPSCLKKLGQNLEFINFKLNILDQRTIKTSGFYK